MNEIATRLNAYIKNHPFDAGDSGCETVLEQLYQAYAESHESDPEEIEDGFKELEKFLHTLPLEDTEMTENLDWSHRFLCRWLQSICFLSCYFFFFRKTNTAAETATSTIAAAPSQIHTVRLSNISA